MKNSQKGFAAIFSLLSLIIVIFIIGFGTYFYLNRESSNCWGEDCLGSEPLTKQVEKANEVKNVLEGLAKRNEVELGVGQDDSPKSEGLLTYSGTTNSGINFSLEYPASWTIYEFSCNTKGVAFWPKEIAPKEFSGVCGMTGSILDTAPIILYKESKPELKSKDNNYKNVFDQMNSSLTQ